MKTCSSCGRVQGSRAVNCLKCGKPFSTFKPSFNPGKPTTKPTAERAPVYGRYVELGESLSTIETMLHGFERSADMDEVIGEVQRARSIARTLG